jgi:branched-chain amino acid transport system ATP-binding protein
MATLLQLKDTWVDYSGVPAVCGVSFEVTEEASVCVIGPNGAGKTTILNTICGLKNASRGEIWFQDQRINGMTAHEIAKLGIGLVPEGSRAFTQMTVRENLEMGAYLCKDVKTLTMNFKRVYDLFPRLKEREKQEAGTLSGGERQMLKVSCALMHNPSLILFDEPTQGLSPLLRKELARRITEMNRQGTHFLLVEQDAYFAMKLTQKGYLLENGRISIEGNTKELLNQDRIRQGYLEV